MLDWDLEKEKVPKRQSVEEMKAVLMGIANTQNKRVKRGESKVDLMHRPPRRFRQTNNPRL